MIELRDLFASVALLALLTDAVDAPPQDIVSDSYTLADMMLQRRQVKDYTVGGER